MASRRAIIILNIAPTIQLEINTTLCHVSAEDNPDPEQHIKYDIHYKAIFEKNDIDQFVAENDRILNTHNTLLVYADIGSDRALYGILIHTLQTLSPKIINKKVYVVSVREFEISDQTLSHNNIKGFRVTNFKDDTFFEGTFFEGKVSSLISTRQQRIKLNGTYYSRAPFGGDNSLPIRTVFETNVEVNPFFGSHPFFGSQSSFTSTFTPHATFTYPATVTPPAPAPFTATFTPPAPFTATVTPPAPVVAPPSVVAPLAPPPQLGIPIVGIDLYNKIKPHLESLLTDLSKQDQVDMSMYVSNNCARELRIGIITNELNLLRRVEYYVGIYKLLLILQKSLQQYDIDYEDARVQNIYKKIMNGEIKTKKVVQRAIKTLGAVKKHHLEEALGGAENGFRGRPLPNKLTCQWWFERFFDTIFDCGKGKIFQTGGTCYLTATLNSILLSNFVKYILIHKMKTVMEDGESKQYITTPLINTVSKCVRHLYMYRILYNMICSEKYGDGISIEKISGDRIIAMDLMSPESSKFFCAEDIHGCQKPLGYGGNSRSTSYIMLLESEVPFVVALKSEAGQFRMPDEKITTNIRKSIYMAGANIFKDLKQIDKINTESIDIILYIDDTEPHQLSKKDKLYRTEEFSELGFDVDTCTISYHVEAHGDTSHSIAGFSCDGNYKFYDNSTNVSFPIDWSKGLDANKYEKYDFGVEFREFRYMKFETAFYVNRKKIHEYLSNGTCPSQ